MAIFSYSEFIKHPPKQKGYVADTSFILRTISTKEKEALQLKEAILKAGSVLFYNVNIRNELYHFMRFLLIEERLEKSPQSFNPQLIKLWELTEKWGDAPHIRLKKLVQAGYVDLFGIVFGKNAEILENECNKALAGFKYISKEDFPALVKWENMAPLMAMYGLDSSDAMIVNLAASHQNFSGIISADYDYMFCAQSLDIVVPQKRQLPAAKNCVP